MPTLPHDRIAQLIEPYYPFLSDELVGKLSLYLDLLLKWNARTNLTAIRSPEEIVTRHFGESLFVARYLPFHGSLLDLGSGAGFPGLPIQLALPAVEVTLAESQGKKAAFLQEAVRTLCVPASVWGARVEDIPDGLRFDTVTLRAVDNRERALLIAKSRVRAGGLIVEMAGCADAVDLRQGIAVPGMDRSFLYLHRC